MDALMRDLAEHPHDVDAYLVYADELQIRGDVRGELIALQIGLATGDTNAELRQRERELVGAAEAELVGDLPADAFSFEWRFGFVDRVEIRGDVADVVAERGLVLGDARLRLLREALYCPPQPGSTPSSRTLASWTRALCAAPFAATLERIAIGDRNKAAPAADELSELVARLPRLRMLELSASRPPAFSALANVRELALWLGQDPGLSTLEGLGAIANAALPALTRLIIGLPGQQDGGQVLAALAPILDAANQHRLAHLAVMGSGIVHRALADLPDRAILGRLASLGLTWRMGPGWRLESALGEAAAARVKAAFAGLTLVWPRPPGRPASHSASHALAELECSLGLSAAALPNARAACEAAPGIRVYWSTLGHVYGELGRREERLAAYERAIALDSRDSSQLWDRGRALVELGRLEDARDAFESALGGNQTRLEVLRSLADVYQQLGRPDEVARIARQTIAARDAQDFAFNEGSGWDLDQEHRRIGAAHLRVGHPGDALAIARQLGGDSGTYHTRYLAVAALRDLGRTAEALAACEPLVADSTPARANVARLQRALLAGLPPALVEHDGCPPCAVLALAEAVLLGDPTNVHRRIAELDGLIAIQLPHYLLVRYWDVVDTIATVAAAADVELDGLLRETYRRVTRWQTTSPSWLGRS